MKLIVLCGPENSGKTTILKMVYEEVKQDNQEETGWFKYYDDNSEHNDFRDVLVLDDDKNCIGTPILKNDFGKEIKKIIDEIKKQNYEIKNSEDGIKVKEKLKLIIDNDVKDFNDVSFELFLPSSHSNLEAEQLTQEQKNREFQEKHTEYLYRQPENTPNPINNQKKTVGFILEGDFGFISPSTSWWTKHPQNLYTHLKNLEECDVIICACSILHRKSILQQPLLCLIQFIYECISKGTLTGFYHKNTPFPLPNDWCKRMVSNKPIVDCIKSQI